jgi:hypothetical protein
MDADSQTTRLLKATFSADELAYLSAQGAFTYSLSKDDGTLDSFERLVELGTLLLRRRLDAPPQSN